MIRRSSVCIVFIVHSMV